MKTSPSSINQQPISESPSLRPQNIQIPVSAPKSNNSSVIVNSPNSSAVNNSGIDAASPILLLIGCFLIDLFLLAINPALPIFTALLALGPALLASVLSINN